MKTTKFKLRAIVGLMLIALSSPAFGQNLAVNGDFESGNVGFTSEFTYSAGNISEPGTYDIVTDPNLVHGAAPSYGDHTSGEGLMLAANGTTDTDSTLWSQQISVLPNTDYQFSVWTSTWFTNAGLQLLINSESVGEPFFTPTTTGQWELTTRIWNSGTSDTAVIELVNVTGQFLGNDFALDDIIFTAAIDTLLGDVNLDGNVNLLDVSPFIDRISTGTFQAEADINQDGMVNLLDVSPFVELLQGG